MKLTETSNLSYFFEKISRFLLTISAAFFLIISLSFSNSIVYADTNNSGLGLDGSNPERTFYESKVLDESAQNGKGENQRFYSRDRENDTLAGPGKMYPYNDIDPRQDTTNLNKKVDQLVKGAEQSIVDRPTNHKNLSRELSQKQRAEAVEIKEKLKNVPQDLGDRVKSNIGQLQNKVGQESENIRTNAEDFAESVPKVLKQGTRSLKDKVSDATLN